MSGDVRSDLREPDQALLTTYLDEARVQSRTATLAWGDACTEVEINNFYERSESIVNSDSQSLNTSSLVTLDTPSALAPRVLNALKADPRTVDLRALAPHFYNLGARILE